MEDTEATELVQRGVAADRDGTSVIDMGMGDPGPERHPDHRSADPRFWAGYRTLMGLERRPTAGAPTDDRSGPSSCPLQDAYIAMLDTDALELWPEMFADDCLYEIIPKENEDLGLPAGLIHCDSKAMLRDRVVSLRNANIFEAHSYRHMTSGLTFAVDAGTVDMQSSYLVMQTRSNGESASIRRAATSTASCARDRWRYRWKRVIYDTSRVQTLLATPI